MNAKIIRKVLHALCENVDELLEIADGDDECTQLILEMRLIPEFLIGNLLDLNAAAHQFDAINEPDYRALSRYTKICLTNINDKCAMYLFCRMNDEEMIKFLIKKEYAEWRESSLYCLRDTLEQGQQLPFETFLRFIAEDELDDIFSDESIEFICARANHPFPNNDDYFARKINATYHVFKRVGNDKLAKKFVKKFKEQITDSDTAGNTTKNELKMLEKFKQM